MIDLFKLTAEKIHNLPQGWILCSVTLLDSPLDLVEITWQSSSEDELQTIRFQQDDLIYTANEWEVDNEKCCKCEGAGEEMFGWSKIEGINYRQCRR